VDRTENFLRNTPSLKWFEQMCFKFLSAAISELFGIFAAPTLALLSDPSRFVQATAHSTPTPVANALAFAVLDATDVSGVFAISCLVSGIHI